MKGCGKIMMEKPNIHLSKEEIEQLVRTLKWVKVATQGFPESLDLLIKRLETVRPISPDEIS